MLRKEQAGFRKGRSCSDHIFTLRQIIEQSYEWNTTVYLNFIDFSKAFDSIHRPALWKILSYYGIPQKIISVIKMLYSDFRAHVICGSNLTDQFSIKSGVRQGCILSPILFCLCIDWMMKRVTAIEKRGIKWTFQECLEDLDYADDITLISQRFQDLQTKTTDLAATAQQIGLMINTNKTKVMKINAKQHLALMIDNRQVEEVDDFTYLGSKITSDGNSEKDVQQRINKARGAFAALGNIWKSTKLKTNTKLKIFRSNVLGVLLYGAESWKVTMSVSNKLDVFPTRCLRRILRIFWPNTIPKEKLYHRTNTNAISTMIKCRRWRWIGHVQRMNQDAIPRIAMRWTPDGRRKRGRPRETWRRSCEKEMKRSGMTWGQIQKRATDRQQWRSLVLALCANGHEEDR